MPLDVSDIVSVDSVSVGGGISETVDVPLGVGSMVRVGVGGSVIVVNVWVGGMVRVGMGGGVRDSERVAP